MRPARGREQVIPKNDPGGMGCAFHRAGAEIVEKGYLWMETSSVFVYYGHRAGPTRTGPFDLNRKTTDREPGLLSNG